MDQKAINQASIKYNADKYDQIKVFAPKEYKLQGLIELACNQKNTSKAKYIIAAIQAQLAKDGITLDMLPSEEATPES